MEIEEFSGYEFIERGGFTQSLADDEWSGERPADVCPSDVAKQLGASSSGAEIVRHDKAFRVRDNQNADHIFATFAEAEEWIREI